MKQTIYPYGGLDIQVNIPTEEEWVSGATRAVIYFMDRKAARAIDSIAVKIKELPYLDRVTHADLDAIERGIKGCIEKIRNHAKYGHLVANAEEPLTNWQKQGLTHLGNHPNETAQA